MNINNTYHIYAILHISTWISASYTARSDSIWDAMMLCYEVEFTTMRKMIVFGILHLHQTCSYQQLEPGKHPEKNIAKCSSRKCLLFVLQVCPPTFCVQ